MPVHTVGLFVSPAEADMFAARAGGIGNSRVTPFTFVTGWFSPRRRGPFEVTFGGPT
jgi:hypothetical protein